jgi:hypothetical protein
MIAKFEHIRNVRPIAENVDDAKRLNPYIDEVEELIIIPALGAEMYKKIETTPEENKFVLEGGFNDDNTIQLAGLYKAIGYLVYSRFVRNNNVNATAFGMVQKQSVFSEPIDEKTIIRIANDAEKIGMEYLRQAIDYLKKDNCEKKIKNHSRIKIIGK